MITSSVPPPLSSAPGELVRVGDNVTILSGIYAGRTDRVSRIENRQDYNAYYLRGIQGGNYAFTAWDLKPCESVPAAAAETAITGIAPASPTSTILRLPNKWRKPCKRCGKACQSYFALCQKCGVIARREERDVSHAY